MFYGENRPTVRCHNAIRFSGVDVITLVWSRLVVIQVVLLVYHFFDLCWIGYHYVPTVGVVVSECGHYNSQQSKIMEYGVPRHIAVHKFSDGC